MPFLFQGGGDFDADVVGSRGQGAFQRVPCRLRRRGRIVTLPQALLTSSRRWQKLGLLRITLVDQLMVLGFVCGMPVHVLARLYRGGKEIESR